MEQAILYSLDNGFLDSAVLLSEQLYYTDLLSSHARFLHGLCLFRAREFQKAHLLTHNVRHLGCAYIFAQTCLVLKRYKQGISALVAVQAMWTNTCNFYSHTEMTRRLLPDCAAVNCLLAQLYRGEQDIETSIECYVRAVRNNPFLWEAFQGLLDLGVEMQVKNVFRPSEFLKRARSLHESPGTSIEEDLFLNSHATPDVFSQQTRQNPAKNVFRPTLPLTRLDEFDTPNGPATPTLGLEAQRSALDALNGSTIQAPTRTKAKAKLTDLTAPRFALTRNASEPANGHGQRTSSKEDVAPVPSGQRRSSRLNLPSMRSKNKPATVRRTNTKPLQNSGSSQRNIRPNASAEDSASSVQKSKTGPLLPSLESEMSAQRRLCRMGEAYHALSKYQCQRSIDLFKALDSDIRASPSIVAKLGRAYYEHGKYEEASAYYEELRRIAPARLEDTELYSTCLWHLRREVELSFLAHEILDLDRLSPRAWCILANCFSLQREHDQALKCVKRAIQLDNDFAYAHTLEGHEYAANEEFEKAQTSFRNALRSDNRHYNAWYGLGMAYMKTGDNEQAEFHFLKAAQINPTNAVLVCCIGIVMERSRRWTEALQQYERACQLAPQNALARFKKAKALIMARDYKSAMNDLHILKELAPDEANVHYLLGKMYKQFGDKVNAMKHLTIAMNLDNKASHLVKEAIENMDELDNSMVQ